MVMALLGVLVGTFVLWDPRWVLDLFLGGRAAPAAYDALTYTESFRHGQAPWLLVLILLNVPLLIAAIVNGRKSAIMRRVELEWGMITCAVLAWTLLGGRVLVAPESDRMAKGIVALILVFSLIDVGIKLRRSVTPAPQPQP